MNDESRGRILAIDIGSVRIGLALSDELRLTAQPLEVIPRKPEKKLLHVIRDIIDSKDVRELVVGLPLNLKGEDTLSTTDAREFADVLKQRFPTVPVVLWDERMTTAASESFLIDAGVRRSKRRQVVDKIAAVMILDSYLQYKRIQKNRRAQPGD